jgi:hypothetical protein
MTMTPEAYNAWSLLLQTIIGFAVVATFVVYYKQLGAMRDASLGQNLVTVHTYMTDDHFRRERRALFELGESGKPFSSWSPDERRGAEGVCAKYHLIAVIVSKKVVPFELVADEVRYSMTKCHKVAEPLLEEVRRQRVPDLWAEFSRMVERLESR